MAGYLTLGLQLSGSVEDKLELQPDSMGKAYEIMTFWDKQPRRVLSVDFLGEPRKIEYVLAPQPFLDYIMPNERFGCIIGDCMFVNETLEQTRPDWVPLIALKLHSERYVQQGLDESGRAKHWAALGNTIRIAGAVMQEAPLREFLEAIRSHETTRYFELDQQVKEFIERGDGDTQQARRKYLENHHRNRYVTAGRSNEELASRGHNIQGDRIHAQAILETMRDLDARNLYHAAAFVQAMLYAPTNTPITIEPPYTSFAYALTKAGNGLADLVHIAPNPNRAVNERSDTIIKSSGRMRTWTALAKRLAFLAHQQEKEVRRLSAGSRKTLEAAIEEASDRTSVARTELALLQSGLASQTMPFALARERLSAVAEYGPKIAALDTIAAEAAETLAQMDRISSMLLKVI